MVREELAAAGDALESAQAAATTDSAKSRLGDQAEQLRRLATNDRGPDHGRLARHERILASIKEDDPATEADVDAALEHIKTHRETLEGV